MSFIGNISVKNLKRKPARTAALVMLAAFLSFTVFCGTFVVSSLKNGLASYKARLGADIVVVPDKARSKGTLDSILLQGIPGYFYMDGSVLDKIRNIEGVETATPQFYLATASAGCCSASVQVIGFDPETDFSVQPWIRESYSGTIGDGDIIVGCNINVPPNKKLVFYNTECNVAAQLSETGSGLDNAVYAGMGTIRKMMRNASDLGFDYFEDVDTDRAVSSVMIKVADGYSIQQVTDDINIHVRRVLATQAKSMISNIAGGLSDVSGIATVLIVIIWVLSAAILIAAFSVIINERSKEFAILRTVGASQGMLTSMIRTEASVICIGGAAAGVIFACLTVIPFGTLIRHKMELPYLMPSVPVILMIAVGALLLSVLAGAAASFVTVRVSRRETGLILRDGA